MLHDTVAETMCDELRLMDQLFHHYDQSVRPRRNSSQTVNVQVRFNLQQINDLVRDLPAFSLLVDYCQLITITIGHISYDYASAACGSARFLSVILSA